MSEYGLFKSTDILNLSPDGKKCIIESLLWERDNVLLLAQPKVGKSILAQQIVFSISSGIDFLGKYKTEKSSCLYCMFEGDKYDLSSNMNCMREALPLCEDNLWIFYHFGLTLNTTDGASKLMGVIDGGIARGMPSPKVIVIDCLYMAFKGRLSDDDKGSDFCRNARLINDRYNTAIILIHHTHRAHRDEKGVIVEEGDDGFYGSFLWKAFPNHILLLGNMPGKGKVITCNTQRMGKVLKRQEMDFLEPNPLIFEPKQDIEVYLKSVNKILNDSLSGISIEGIISKSTLDYNIVKSCINRLRHSKIIERVGKDKWGIRKV